MDVSAYAGVKPVVQLSEPFSASVYPNPAKNYVNVALSDNRSPSFISVCDMQGKELINEMVAAHNSSQWQMDVSALAPGLYLLKIVSAGNTVTRKLEID